MVSLIKGYPVFVKMVDNNPYELKGNMNLLLYFYYTVCFTMDLRLLIAISQKLN